MSDFWWVSFWAAFKIILIGKLVAIVLIPLLVIVWIRATERFWEWVYFLYWKRKGFRVGGAFKIGWK